MSIAGATETRPGGKAAAAERTIGALVRVGCRPADGEATFLRAADLASCDHRVARYPARSNCHPARAAALWPRKRTVDRSAPEVVGFLRDFLEGSGGEWDWDQFESVPITDPDLERIRQQATTPGADLRQAERTVRARSA